MEKKNTKKKNLPIKDAFKVLSFLFAAVLISACSREIVFPVSQVVPSAEASLEVNENDNKNYEIELEVKNLAQPNRLTPARRNYVVWMVTKRQGTIILGNLNVNKNGNATLETSVPYEPVRVFITAEDDNKPVVPSTQIVLDSQEFKV